MSHDAEITGMSDDEDFGFHSAVIDAADSSAPSAHFSLGKTEDADTKSAGAALRSGRRRMGVRRRLTSVAIVAGALLSIGGGYALLAPSSGAADSAASAADIQAGRLLYQTTCISCHGANLQGVLNRGPSLVGAGGAATYFQVGTGRMPLVQQGAQAERKPSKFTDAQVRQLADYVQSIGGGVDMPSASTNYRTNTDAQLSAGGELFRLNCASCHNFAAKGAPLSAGKVAPSMAQATDAQIYAAMVSGPESMPVFSNNQITPAQKQELITYIQTLKASPDPGGASLGRVGPISEGLLIWTLGLGALVVTILWIGAKS